MAGTEIRSITARQVYTNRGNPGVEAVVTTENGATGRAMCTSGISIGTHEIHFDFDGGERFRGKGVLGAVRNVNEIIAPALKGLDAANQRLIDRTMLDIVPDAKAKLGGNATAAVSAAVLKAGAAALGIPLYRHIGGANALAARLAGALGAAAVITTATDVNGKFAVDAWAAQNGCAIEDFALAKRFAAEILEHDLPLCSEFPVCPPLPGGVVAAEEGPFGVYIGCRTESPFGVTLRLIPRKLRVGLGCRRGTEQAAIETAVRQVFRENRLALAAISGVSSIDLKQDEPGLLAACRANGWQARFYSAAQLRAVPGSFTGSRFVASVTGVDNVCERAALYGGGRLLVQKQALGGVTVAVAEEPWEVRFG